jgi:iron(III) transport system substrate-binding protein
LNHVRLLTRVAASAALVLSACLPAAADINSAKKEGTVVWYGTMNTKDMTIFANGFMKSHPGIKVETLRLGSSQLPARVATEQRAGKYNADVISGDGFQVQQLVGIGAFEKYSPPDTRAFIKGAVDPNGYWTNLYQNTTVIAWNPDRLKADHLKPPTSPADFAKPEWKGRFGMDTGALNWYTGLLQTDKGGADLAQRIANNNPVKMTGHTQTVTSLETGEYDATPTAYGYLADQEHRAGKAVNFMNPNPLFVSLNPVGVAKNAPHPNAAKVFVDWAVSKAGQNFIVHEGGGEISSRSDVHNNPAVFDPKKPFVITTMPDSSQYNELAQKFRSLLGLPG